MQCRGVSSQANEVVMSVARVIGAGVLTLAGLSFVIAVPRADAAVGKKTAVCKPVARVHRKAALKRQGAGSPSTALPGVTRLQITPASALLDGPRAVQHLVVTATLKDGT